MKKTVFYSISIVFLLLTRPLSSLAETTDIVLQAMQDEIARSMKSLKLNGHERPYFISYRLTEYDTKRISAASGAITDNTNTGWRNLKVDVREGNYHLDNSGFSMRPTAALSALSGSAGGTMTIDNDYDAIRNTLWLRTDTAYKTAIINFEAKKNFLEQNNIPERPDDFSQEATTVSIEKPTKEADCNQWQSFTMQSDNANWLIVMST